MKVLLTRLRMTLALRRSAHYGWRESWRRTAFLVRDDDAFLGI